ncbi:long-chain-fatty-acid--CoA ligase, partial [Plasmodium cynomolgi strain B]
MDVTNFKRRVYNFLENENEYVMKNDDGEDSDDASEIKYFDEVKGTAKKNSSNIYRPKKYELCQIFEKTKGFLGIEMSNKYEVLCFACKYYYNEDFLGERKKEVRGNETILGEYSFKTYGEIKNEIEILASALYQFENIEPNIFTDNGPYDKLKILGIWSKNRVEWLTTDYACSAIDFVTVPIYDTMGINSVKYIFQKTQMKICCIEAEKLECLIKLKDELTDLKILIIYDEWSLRDDIKQRASKAGYKVYFYKDLIDKFKNQNIIPQYEYYDHSFHSQEKGEKADKSSVNNVSGGKGQKGVKKGTDSKSGTGGGSNTHVYERLIEFAVCFYGAKIGYFSGNIKELVSDINELKPTFLIT